jgi:hypothetical protein
MRSHLPIDERRDSDKQVRVLETLFLFMASWIFVGMWAWDLIVMEGGVSTKVKAVVPIAGLALAAGILNKGYLNKREDHTSHKTKAQGASVWARSSGKI